MYHALAGNIPTEQFIAAVQSEPKYQAFLGEKGKDGSEKGRELKERNA